MPLWNNYLTIVGPRATVDRFDKDDTWERILGARHIEWLELSPKRRRREFKTSGRVLVELQKLSRLWTPLVFLLDYEWEPKRIKGLAKVKAGDIESCEISY